MVWRAGGCVAVMDDDSLRNKVRTMLYVACEKSEPVVQECF